MTIFGNAMAGLSFHIQAIDKNTSARAGKISGSRGEILTPVFMPVGTAGSVKAIHQRELTSDINAQVILGNTYHLYLRPGTEILHQAGGLHRFMNWDRYILTDSGGYQVFSLSDNRKLTEEGAMFKSHIDGSSHLFTPENIIDIQRIIGADIIMAFDECPPYPCEYEYVKKSMCLTHQWLDRAIIRYNESESLYGHPQSLFPIVQGGVFSDLRKESAEKVAACNLDGNAIGGLSVGEPVEEMYQMLEIVNQILPASKPRYLMGVGTPANILESISRGVDMFDCVMPTRNGRNGMLFTSKGIINIKNEKWKNDFSALDPDRHTFVDDLYSKAYLRHLFASEEILGMQIASIHNLGFYMWLVTEARNKIMDGSFTSWKTNMVLQLSSRL